MIFTGFRPNPTVLFETQVRVVPSSGSVAELKETFNFARIPCSFSFDGCSVSLSCDRQALKFDVSVADDTPFNERSGWWSWSGDSPP